MDNSARESQGHSKQNESTSNLSKKRRLEDHESSLRDQLRRNVEEESDVSLPSVSSRLIAQPNQNEQQNSSASYGGPSSTSYCDHSMSKPPAAETPSSTHRRSGSYEHLHDKQEFPKALRASDISSGSHSTIGNSRRSEKMNDRERRGRAGGNPFAEHHTGDASSDVRSVWSDVLTRRDRYPPVDNNEGFGYHLSRQRTIFHQHDNDREQSASTPSSAAALSFSFTPHDIPGGHLNNYPESSSLLSQILRLGEDTAGSRFDAGLGSSDPAFSILSEARSQVSAPTAQGGLQSASHSTSASYRDTLLQYYQHLEREKTKLLAASEPMLLASHLNSFRYDGPRRTSYSENRSYPRIGHSSDTLQQQLQEPYRYNAQRLSTTLHQCTGLSASPVESELKHHHSSTPSILPNRSDYVLPTSDPNTGSSLFQRLMATAQETAAPNFSATDASTSRLLLPNDSIQSTYASAVSSSTTTVADNPRQQEERGESRLGGATQSSGAGGVTPAPPPPPCVEGPLPHYSERTVLPLGLEEDKHWCSAFSTYVRSELVEVFRASGDDVASRINGKRIIYHQVGIRCKFCAHLPRSQRRRRSATFPHSLSRVHQGVSMMVREHFMDCNEVPEAVKKELKRMQETDSHPELKSRTYWLEAAKRLGLVDTSGGLMFHSEHEAHHCQEIFVDQDDREGVPDFLYFLMSQCRRIRLIGFDRYQSTLQSLPLGMAGFGCRHCSEMGPNRTNAPNRYFPSKVRHVSHKVNQLYNHIQQCDRCPQEIKDSIALLRDAAQRKQSAPTEDEGTRAFFFRIFVRLQGNVPTGVPVEYSDLPDGMQLEDLVA